ncbi:transcriptional regulator [Azospirillum sp. TSH58]|uniref:XRE family transcriptional regulator n=3 Tax=Azospirillaceae TaxID=2829815 RepID=A0A4D8R0U1_AZOBR|nr:transcriptional regulator [Azospirillum sp. TSH58]PWC69506.1 hypothetical protein TSH58_15320 [Azospirillum sp. TSH58]QCO16267.1 XRE family transcriptional regulator [Azospirillum brasilense]
MTPRQCAMARAALRLSVRDLAAAAMVGVNTVSRFENGKNTEDLSIKRMQTALESAGVAFIGDGEQSLGGGLGVRLSVGGTSD